MKYYYPLIENCITKDFSSPIMGSGMVNFGIPNGHLGTIYRAVANLGTFRWPSMDAKYCLYY